LPNVSLRSLIKVANLGKRRESMFLSESVIAAIKNAPKADSRARAVEIIIRPCELYAFRYYVDQFNVLVVPRIVTDPVIDDSLYFESNSSP